MDLHDDSRIINLRPLRLGKLRSAELVGSSFVLNIELADFIETSGQPEHYDAVRTALGDVVPHYDPKNKVKPSEGFYVISAPDSLFSSRNGDMASGFEAAVNALAPFSLFKQAQGADNPCSLFFHVLGVRTISGGFPKWLHFIEKLWLPPAFQTAPPFAVMSGARCELEFYHYSPEIGRSNETTRRHMKASSPSELIEFVSDTRLAVDSEYDVKRVAFDVPRSSTTHHTVIDLSILSADEKSEHAKLSLPVRIRWNFIWVKVQVAAIAAGVALPGVIVLLSSGKPYDKWAIPLMVFSGLVVALAATFGVKRGL